MVMVMVMVEDLVITLLHTEAFKGTEWRGRERSEP
jgi:hypothetical protein